jgi:hypothetical protein
VCFFLAFFLQLFFHPFHPVPSFLLQRHKEKHTNNSNIGQDEKTGEENFSGKIATEKKLPVGTSPCIDKKSLRRIISPDVAEIRVASAGRFAAKTEVDVHASLEKKFFHIFFERFSRMMHCVAATNLHSPCANKLLNSINREADLLERSFFHILRQKCGVQGKFCCPKSIKHR